MTAEKKKEPHLIYFSKNPYPEKKKDAIDNKIHIQKIHISKIYLRKIKIQ
jgi:hypothetical protein